MISQAIPVLHVSSSRVAEDFYCAKLGFDKQFAYRPAADRDDPCYMGLVREGATLHVSSFSGDGVSGAVVYVRTSAIDALHQEFRLKGVPIALEPTDQTWGNREMYVRDPDNNCLRFSQQLCQ